MTRHTKWLDAPPRYVRVAGMALFMCISLAIIAFTPSAHAEEGDTGAETAPLTSEGPVEQQELPPADTSPPAGDGSVDESSSADTDAGRDLGSGTGAPAGSTGSAPPDGSSSGGTGKSGTGFVAIAPIPGLTEGAIANESGIANFLNNLYKYAIGLSAVLAVIMIIWGGLEYATQDSPGGKKSGKERIQQAILGLILILAPALVFSIINPSILNLSVHVPALDTAQRSNNAGGDAPAPKTGRQQPTSSTSMNEMLMNCTTTNCDAEIKKCLEGSSVRDSADYKVVCANMDGSTGPNTPKGGSCGNASQNLAVKCTRFTQAPQTGTYCYAVQGGGTQNEYQCAATLSACNSSRAAYPAEKVKSECAQQ